MSTRLEKRREAYYERDNTPTYSQFKDNYHFVDGEGRRYQLAVQGAGGGGLVSKRLQPHAQPARREAARCLVDNDGYVTLYVRLSTGTPWFERGDMDRALVLRDRDGEEVGVRLRRLIKVSPKRRTGAVLVSGLTVNYCNALLNHQLFL